MFAQVSRAIAVSGAVDLVARLGVGWLTDRPGCAGRRGILLAMVWIITGLNALGFAELSRLKLTADNSRASDPDSLCVRGSVFHYVLSFVPTYASFLSDYSRLICACASHRSMKWTVFR
ncbi:hypothetical protein AHF37_08930 [Paragonimus kellicotti]|nr:hypothetical protein AHF37_08930 [Paragonimus kellicotti]